MTGKSTREGLKQKNRVLKEASIRGKQLDAELLQNENFVLSILRTVPTIIYIYDLTERRNVYANHEISVSLGYTPDQIRAMGSKLFLNILHPDDVLLVARHHVHMATVGKNEMVEIEYRMKHANGEWRWLRSRDTSFKRDKKGKTYQILGSAEDITTHKQMEEEIRKSEKRYRYIVEDQTEFICRHQNDGTLTFVNKALCSFHQMKREDLLGRSFFTFLSEENRRNVRKALNALCPESPVATLQTRLILPGGNICWLEWTSRMIHDKKGVFVEYQSIGRDITLLKTAEEALKKVHHELELRVLKRTAELAKASESMKAALAERNQAMKLLKKREADLFVESQRLREMNMALNVLLRKQSEDKQELEMTLLSNVRRLVLPYVEKLKLTNLTPVQTDFANIIAANLQNVISPFLKNLMAVHMDLTPREIEVVNLTREGKTAKECAALMNISARSVEFYKDNIRKKLGLSYKKTNLRSHLMSLS